MKRGDKVLIADGLYFDGYVGEVEIVGVAHVTVTLHDKGRDYSIKFWRKQVISIS